VLTLCRHFRPSAPAIATARQLVLLACLAAGDGAFAADAGRTYDIDYVLTIEPGDGTVKVELDLEQDKSLLREIRFGGKRITHVEGDGKLEKEEGDYVWVPPAAGGKLSWRATVRHKRNDGGYDAWLDEDWGLFRAEDVIPRASTRGRRDASANTTLRFVLPEGWSAVTEYREFGGPIAVPPGSRRFRPPAGWIVVGELGVRREQIAGTRVAIAAPVGEDVRRMDLLALLSWTLPELARLLPQPLPRLTVVSAGEPMWRGALSAPQSFYMHADRPLISENGTSTPLHELMHVALGIAAERGHDWIVEGFAEYYSLELLRRSGTISLPRYAAAIEHLRNWSGSVKTLCDRNSTGAETALAVTVMHALDREIDKKTDGSHSLDDLLYTMVASGRKMSLGQLRDEAKRLIGKNADALRDKHLPGCAMLDD
jgi:hypothetical protein